LATMAFAHHACLPTDLPSYFTWLKCYGISQFAATGAGGGRYPVTVVSVTWVLLLSCPAVQQVRLYRPTVS